MSNLYSKIKAIRIEKKLTQQDVAKLIGTNQSNYTRIESGLTALTIERIEQLAQVFEMTVSEMLHYEGGEIENSEVSEYINKIKELELKITKLQKKQERDMIEESDKLDYWMDKAQKEKEELKLKIDLLNDKLKKKDEILKDREERIKERDDRLKEKDERLKDKDLVIDTLKMLISSKGNNNN